MCIFKPLANISSASADGDTSPFIILLIVDFDIPVIVDTWRTDKFFSYMIFASSIFMVTIVICYN